MRDETRPYTWPGARVTECLVWLEPSSGSGLCIIVNDIGPSGLTLLPMVMPEQGLVVGWRPVALLAEADEATAPRPLLLPTGSWSKAVVRWLDAELISHRSILWPKAPLG